MQVPQSTCLYSPKHDVLPSTVSAQATQRWCHAIRYDKRVSMSPSSNECARSAARRPRFQLTHSLACSLLINRGLDYPLMQILALVLRSALYLAPRAMTTCGLLRAKHTVQAIEISGSLRCYTFLRPPSRPSSLLHVLYHSCEGTRSPCSLPCRSAWMTLLDEYPASVHCPMHRLIRDHPGR